MNCQADMQEPYSPHRDTVKFMIWVKRYLPPLSNKTSTTHYKLIDYYSDAKPDDIQLAEIHRGWGKSQWNMLYAMYLVAIGEEDYALFVGATMDLSIDIVASAGSMLEESNIPGVGVVRNVEGIVEILRRDGSVGYLVAKSIGSKLRGVAKGPNRYRPTIIVLDDIVSDDIVMNKMRMDRAIRWIASALLPTLVPGGRVIGSGTPLHKADPFMTLVKAFGSYKIPLSSTSFPDRFTPEFIERKRAQYKKLGQIGSWKREMELVLTDSENAIFDISKVRTIDGSDVPEGLTWFMTLDGAFSEKSANDYSAFTCLGIDKNHRWYAAVYDIKGQPQEVINMLFALQAKYGSLSVGIEKGAFLLSMKREIDRKRREYQQHFHIEELSTSGSKISRIKALAPVINNGELTVIDTGEASERLMEQIEMANADGVPTQYDDHIDSLCQMVQMPLHYSEPHSYSREEYEEAINYEKDNLWD